MTSVKKPKRSSRRSRRSRCSRGVAKVAGVRSPGNRCKSKPGPKRSRKCANGVKLDGACAKKVGRKSRRSRRRSRK
jgi:hypothetical protein